MYNGYNMEIGTTSGVANMCPDAESGSRRCSCCYKRPMTNVAGAAVVLLVIAGVIGVIVLKILPQPGKGKVCETATCLNLSLSVTSYLDLDTPPCTDFYKFACGSWSQENPIPPGHVSFDTLQKVAKGNTVRLYQSLSDTSYLLNGRNSSAVKKTKDFFKICMDTTAIENLGIGQIMEVIRDLRLEFESNSNELARVMAKLYHLGGNPFFSVDVITNPFDNSHHVIKIGNPTLTFQTSTDYKDTNRVVFTKFFVSVHVALGANKTDAMELAEDVWRLETFLLDEINSAKVSITNVTLYGLQSRTSSWLDVPSLFRNIFGVGLGRTEKLLVLRPTYIGSIGEVLRAFKSSTISEYLMWLGTLRVIQFMPDKFRKMVFEVEKQLLGKSVPLKRWEICVLEAEVFLAQSTGAIFVENFFSDEDKREVEEILKEIKGEFARRLERATWMDRFTRRQALRKLSLMSQKVGYPSMARNAALLDSYYHSFELKTNNPLGTWRSLLKFVSKRSFAKYRKIPDHSEWSESPAITNAFYVPTKNGIFVPAGILQPPIFDRSFPAAFNFGAIGSILGHEITHGFDNRGAYFDSKGNFNSWWTIISMERFTEKTSCLESQYNQFYVGHHQVNGKHTLGENIADNGGLKMALGAYQSWLKKYGGSEPQPPFPGLNFTSNEQIFFLAFGQLWCSKSTPKVLERLVLYDVHAPNKFRVKGTLQNMKTFADVFSCPESSAMNRGYDRCSVW